MCFLIGLCYLTCFCSVVSLNMVVVPLILHVTILNLLTCLSFALEAAAEALKAAALELELHPQEASASDQ